MGSYITGMKKRILSFVLCLVMLFGYVAILPAQQMQVRAATANQNNIVARANYLYNATWVCQKTVSGWRGNYTFTKGNTYHLPYGQPVSAGAYIGYSVSVDAFLEAAANANSVFYTSKSNYAGNIPPIMQRIALPMFPGHGVLPGTPRQRSPISLVSSARLPPAMLPTSCSWATA